MFATHKDLDIGIMDGLFVLRFKQKCLDLWKELSVHSALFGECQYAIGVNERNLPLICDSAMIVRVNDLGKYIINYKIKHHGILKDSTIDLAKKNSYLHGCN